MTITLTDEQIEAGQNAAMERRTSRWKPTPPEGVALARRLFKERGKFNLSVECEEVGRLIGWSQIGIRQRYLCGELGLPTPNVERALAFAAGQLTYTRADGSLRRVGDDRNDHHERANWGGRGEMGSGFLGFTADDYAHLWDACGGRCPCCDVEMDGASRERQATLDHLIPSITSKQNARLICSACNVIKQNALPYHIHRAADWMTMTPAEMLACARTLPEMPRQQVNGADRWKGMLRGKKWNAKNDGIDFSLTIDDVPFTAMCPVLGIPFLLPGSEEMTGALKVAGVRNRPFWNSASFDRIDPKQGYVPGNVLLVSNLANKIMQNATSPDRVRIVAEWFERELTTAPDLAALIDFDAHAHWAIAAE